VGWCPYSKKAKHDGGEKSQYTVLRCAALRNFPPAAVQTDRNVITRRDAVKCNKNVEMLVNHPRICVRIFIDLKINNSHQIQLWDMRKSAY
jgi:hypothetical protein